MRSILCFGDSNTYGARPEGGRYGHEDRWPRILQQLLGDRWYVVEEGLNGRTTVQEDHVEIDKNGLRHLPVAIASHRPLDLIVIALGVNDLKARFDVSPEFVADGVARLARFALESLCGPGEVAPQVLVISPPPLARLSGFAELFAGGTEKSKRLADLYRDRAAKLGVRFLDGGSVVTLSDADGIHLVAEDHKKLAAAVAREVQAIFAG